MPDSIGTLLFLMCLLQIKHMFADFFLQTRIMLRGRAQYLHAGRLLHVLLHGLLTATALCLVGTSLKLVLSIFVAESLVHFHIDYFKSRFTLTRALTPTQAIYWQALGLDQALHQLTYVVIIGVWLWQTGVA